MEKIASFTVDHQRLLRGIYVSRRDVTRSGDTLTTFDIRMTEPNRQPPLSGAALHTIEHLAATYLRNRSRLERPCDILCRWDAEPAITSFCREICSLRI